MNGGGAEETGSDNRHPSFPITATGIGRHIRIHYRRKESTGLVKVAPSARSSSWPLGARNSRRHNRQMRRPLFAVDAIGFEAFENGDFWAENRPPA